MMRSKATQRSSVSSRKTSTNRVRAISRVSSERLALHRLLDRVPDREVPTARRFLEYLSAFANDPFWQALQNAPYDDEPETPEERAAVEQAKRELAEGKGIPHAEVVRRLGLKHGRTR
jgi:hypothetical protein